MGTPSVIFGRYFRMHLVGYFEGIDSEREAEDGADRIPCRYLISFLLL